MSNEFNPVGWFEIPVTDMERAMKFYETVLDVKLERHEMGPLDMAWFPPTKDAKGSSGSLVKHPDFYKPSPDGVLIYFTAPGQKLDDGMAKAESVGGKILVPKKQISPTLGYMCVLQDSEGNRLALHSRE